MSRQLGRLAFRAPQVLSPQPTARTRYLARPASAAPSRAAATASTTTASTAQVRSEPVLPPPAAASPPPSALAAHICAAIEDRCLLGRVEEAILLVGQLHAAGGKVTTRELNWLLFAALKKRSSFGLGRIILDHPMFASVPPDTITLLMRIRLLCHEGNLMEAKKELDSRREQLVQVARAEAEQLLGSGTDGAPATTWPLDLKTAMRSSSDLGALKDADALFRAPSRVLLMHTLVLRAMLDNVPCCINHAMMWIRELPAELVDAHAYGTVMTWCRKRGDCTGVMMLVNDMRKKGVAFTTEIFNFEIWAAGHFHTSLTGGRTIPLSYRNLGSYLTGVFSRMRDMNVPPNSFTFAVYAEALRAGGEAKAAVELPAQMRAIGIAPDAFVYTAVLDTVVAAAVDALNAEEGGAAGEGDGDDCSAPSRPASFLSSGAASPSSSAASSGRSFSSLAELDATVEQIYMEMVSAGVPFTLQTYAALVRWCGSTGRMGQAARILAQVAQVYPNDPDMHLVQLRLVQAFVMRRQLKWAEQIIRNSRALSSQMTVPRSSVVSILFAGYLHIGRLEDASDVLMEYATSLDRGRFSHLCLQAMRECVRALLHMQVMQHPALSAPALTNLKSRLNEFAHRNSLSFAHPDGTFWPHPTARQRVLTAEDEEGGGDGVGVAAAGADAGAEADRRGDAAGDVDASAQPSGGSNSSNTFVGGSNDDGATEDSSDPEYQQALSFTTRLIPDRAAWEDGRPPASSLTAPDPFARVAPSYWPGLPRPVGRSFFTHALPKADGAAEAEKATSAQPQTTAAGAAGGGPDGGANSTSAAIATSSTAAPPPERYLDMMHYFALLYAAAAETHVTGDFDLILKAAGGQWARASLSRAEAELSHDVLQMIRRMPSGRLRVRRGPS